MAEQGWLGKSISIKCIEPAGTVFQGTIKDVSPDVITIVRAFRNGVPVRKVETEVKIASANIVSLELIPDGTGSVAVTKPTPRTQKQSTNNSNGFKDPSSSSTSQSRVNTNNLSKSPSNGQVNKKFFASNLTPSGPLSVVPVQQQQPPFRQQPPSDSNAQQYNNGQRGNPNGGGGRSYQENLNANGNGNRNNNGNGKNGRRYQNSKSETFGTPVTDPEMDQDFDFETNLALFDKQAVWEKFNQMNGGKPDLLQGSSRHQQQHQPVPKYRHDENILQSSPTQYRQIEVDYNSSRDYVSDDGLIVPSIPLIVRNRLQTAAEAMGLTWERQIDILSRGACDTALQLLGGAPRLKPNNRHQWPNIVVVCEEPYNER